MTFNMPYSTNDLWFEVENIPAIGLPLNFHIYKVPSHRLRIELKKALTSEQELKLQSIIEALFGHTRPIDNPHNASSQT